MSARTSIDSDAALARETSIDSAAEVETATATSLVGSKPTQVVVVNPRRISGAPSVSSMATEATITPASQSRAVVDPPATQYETGDEYVQPSPSASTTSFFTSNSEIRYDTDAYATDAFIDAREDEVDSVDSVDTIPAAPPSAAAASAAATTEPAVIPPKSTQPPVPPFSTTAIPPSIVKAEAPAAVPATNGAGTVKQTPVLLEKSFTPTKTRQRRNWIIGILVVLAIAIGVGVGVGVGVGTRHHNSRSGSAGGDATSTFSSASSSSISSSTISLSEVSSVIIASTSELATSSTSARRTSATTSSASTSITASSSSARTVSSSSTVAHSTSRSTLSTVTRSSSLLRITPTVARTPTSAVPFGFSRQTSTALTRLATTRSASSIRRPVARPTTTSAAVATRVFPRLASSRTTTYVTEVPVITRYTTTDARSVIFIVSTTIDVRVTRTTVIPIRQTSRSV
ncbi:hypothetical protein V1512DRAFT_264999 [Lipomyces arxii]|uniref:uncharacterized protein n=1 Tax=Lipomyces arxii TaxID=56418 RepID=UPI0034D00A82